jgi:hypothetical protein
VPPFQPTWADLHTPIDPSPEAKRLLGDNVSVAQAVSYRASSVSAVPGGAARIAGRFKPPESFPAEKTIEPGFRGLVASASRKAIVVACGWQ